MLPETECTEFNATATFWLRLDRTFRVHATREELILIRIAGQTVDWAAALSQLGFVGVWLGRKLNARRRAAIQAKAEEVDRLSPQVLVEQHPQSFRAGIPEIESASFEPAAAYPMHGPHVAVWRLRLRDGRSSRFQLDNSHDASTALRLLRDVLGDALVVNAVWDEEANRFRRATGQPTPSVAGAD